MIGTYVLSILCSASLYSTATTSLVEENARINALIKLKIKEQTGK